MEAPAVLKINVYDEVKVTDVVFPVVLKDAPPTLIWPPEVPVLSFLQPDALIGTDVTLHWPPLMARAPSFALNTLQNRAVYIA